MGFGVAAKLDFTPCCYFILPKAWCIDPGEPSGVFRKELRHHDFVERRTLTPIVASEEKFGGEAGIDCTGSRQDLVEAHRSHRRINEGQIWRIGVADEGGSAKTEG
ncbi:hypothetical protein JQ615_19305 [Bradyrhizobium jicamae]|uniref:Uncharacterized protein n=1 Tax=Bradyrhizobium jicamae TaxID=280332 RepID=A0ABS5FL85_9BRAD|nr:hypothetical protein [Bradyrhizobium jicamae]MBR0797540.1 hypothetical protein [Bradyrhizobium jicamae]